ncbi:peptide ABC transporter substrate-binding protein [Bifidobacterium aesculapii]|uniref:peptide ABC transporter substrate-binding protein n=1 Tax=Bifidobacterium aesculapii TaxID=1329411 RepID=UPI0009EB4DB1|nr:ABC transporter substrate-binding protein [Bifidobacterium aesculapii]
MGVHSTRVVSLISGAVAAALLLSGCGTSTAAKDTGASKASDTTNETISVYNAEPSSDLIPGNTADLSGFEVINQLYAGLVSFDENGKTHYEVAKSVKANANQTQFTITLKDGWKFSNGEPVTAESFAKAWSFTANATNAQKAASYLSEIKGYDELQDGKHPADAQLSGVSTPDKSTIVVNLKAPDSAFTAKLGSMSFFPLPQVAYKDIKAFGQNPVGNGPYTFKEWQHNAKIVVKRNPQYQGNRVAKNGGIEFRSYTSPESAYADVQAGNLDFLDTIPATYVSQFASDKRVQSFNKPGASFVSLVIPERLKHFDYGQEGNLRRQAISLALDRKLIANKIFHGTVTPATDFGAPPIPGYSKSINGNDVLNVNAKKAKELWDKANAISPWSGDFAIGYSAAAGDRAWVIAAANQIESALGITVKTNEYSTSKEFRSNIVDRSIQSAFITSVNPSYPSLDYYLWAYYSSGAADGKGWNEGDYKNPEFDKLLAQAESESDFNKSVVLYHKAETILFRDLPGLPLWYRNAVGIAGKNVKNVDFTIQNKPFYERLTK